MKKMKSIRYGCALVCSCLAILLLFSVAHASDYEIHSLMAGQHIKVGDVSVWNDAEHLYVKYEITDGWYLIESHVHFAISLDGIPQKNGNPIPGKFDYKMEHDPEVWEYTYEMDLNALETGTVYIATHADVLLLDQKGKIIQEETAWGDGEDFPGANWATYFTYETDNVPPSISITNPVNNSVTTTTTPYITIEFTDNDSGVDLSSFSVQINGADCTSSFDVTDTRATCQVATAIASENNEISASISDNAGNTGAVVSGFTISSSGQPNRYIFSVNNNDWIFASPGDGTYVEYLSREDLGLLSFSDVVALSKVTPDGNLFFTLSGQGGILQSPCNGSNSVLYKNAQLDLESGDQVVSGHIGLLGTGYFSIEGQPNILQSSGNDTNSSFMENYLLGLEYTDLINCLHIGYDNTIYFCGPDGQIVSQSTGGSTNTQFLTAAELGVPGAIINAFAILPKTVPPEITITNPIDGAFLNTTTPNITVTFQDTGSGINTAKFYAEINDTDMTSAFSVSDTGATYQVPGTLPLPVGDNSLTVKIQDHFGNEAGATSNFRLGILRAIPGASPTSGPAPLTVYFTTDGEDPAGTIEIFRWDFDGDSTWDTYDTVANDYTHIYNNPGTYTALLYVQSSTGETATESITITVENNPPVATADVQPSNGEVPLIVQMIGSGTDVDGSIVLYEWDYDGDGLYDWSSSIIGDTSYTYNEVGIYQSVFRVTDDAGLTATAVAYTTVIEANPPGSPTAVAAATPIEGQAPLSVSFNGTGTDPVNDIVLYEWDFDGDGTFDWSSTSSGSTTHTYTEAGLHVARFRATDSTGLTGSDQIGIYVTLNVSLAVTNDTAGMIVDTINLTAMDGVAITASSTYEYCYTNYPVTNLHDGYEYSYWISAPDDTPNHGADTFVETTFASPRQVTQINIKGGDYYQYYGITRATLEFFDDADNLIYSTEEDLPQDAQIPVGLLENIKRFRLTALVANDGGGAYNQVSIGEIEILDDKGFTAAASSIYDPYDPYWCKVENLFTPYESWYSAQGDHPDAGTNPWVEVSFQEPRKVSRIVVDQSWDYGWSGVTRARIELLDGSDTVLFDSEYDLLSYYETIDLPDIENVTTFRLVVLTADNPYNDPNAYVSIYGLDILTQIDGGYVSLVQKADQGTYTASSEWQECYNDYPASNLIDGQAETYWMSAENDIPNNGVYPFVEITFSSPQMVSQITISGGSWYSYYGITRANIELLDANDAVLYSGEHELEALSEITIQDVNDVTKCRVTALESYGYNQYCSWDEIGIYQKLDDPEPTTTDIMTTLSADTTVSVFIKDPDGNIVRTLANNEFRQQGSYSDHWDLNDKVGFRATDGVYYAVLEYVDANGQVTTYDLTHSTGGIRYSFPIGSGCNTRADWTSNFSPFEDQQLALKFTICSAQEVTAFIGPLWSGADATRIATIVNRQAFPAGTHTIYWDGLDDNGNIAQNPPGDTLITGFWRYDLPDNVIYMTGGNPTISDISADPNYFSPFSEKCDEDGNGEGVTIDYTVSENVASVELRVYSIETGSLLRTLVVNNVPAGDNVIFWDGKNNNGEYVDIGDYRVGLIATDGEGNESMFRYCLVRIDY